MKLKRILGYIILLLHNLIIPLLFILFIYTNNKCLLYLIIFYFSMVIVSWMIFGCCLLTIYENYLLEQPTVRYSSGQDRGYTSTQIEKIFGTSTELTHKIATSIPFYMVFFALLKKYFI